MSTKRNGLTLLAAVLLLGAPLAFAAEASGDAQTCDKAKTEACDKAKTEACDKQTKTTCAATKACAK